MKAPKIPAPAPAPKPIRIAYHAGPPDIQFCGRRWLRGAAQPVTQAEQAAMRKRPDFAGFNFIVEEE
ncbi:MAG: hypothetical protein K8H84_03345 [Sulfuricella denitrificans]|nr:hypothetical protein [Sulfuricella denitrificans]